MLKTTLEHLTDELIAATMKAETLSADFGMYCENCEMDGEEAPTEFDETEMKQLRSITTAAREALKMLTELEGKNE